MTAAWRPTPAQRELVILDGLAMGLTVRQLARYIGVSCATVRRDIRRFADRGRLALPLTDAEPWLASPDAYRWKP